MMDREKLRDKVKKDIRALLISAPLGVPAQIFPRDYRQMNGKEVPYREVGHGTLEEFIRSIPDVVRVGMGPTGLVTFYPVATKETQHIVNLIKRQKKPPVRKAVIPSAIMARKTPIKMSSFSRRGGFGSRTPRGGGGGYRRPQGFLPLPSPSLSSLFPLCSHPPPSSHLGPDCLSKLPSARPPTAHLPHPLTAHHPHPPNSHTSLHHISHPSHRHTFTTENSGQFLPLYQHPPSHLLINPHTPNSHPHPPHHHPIPPHAYHPPLLQSHSNPLVSSPRPAVLRRSLTPPPLFPLPPHVHHSHIPHFRPPLIKRPPPPLLPRPHPPHCFCLACRSSPISPSPSVYDHPFHEGGKHHPRAYSQPAYPPPNLPPRLQKAHQHSSTFSHHPHPHHPPSSYSSHHSSSTAWPPHTTASAAAASTQSRGGQTRYRLDSKPDGATSRPRLGSVDNPCNRLHPQHTLGSLSSSTKAAPSSSTGTRPLSQLWREEFRTARHVSVEEMNSLSRSNAKPQFKNPVCVEGTVGRKKEDSYQGNKLLKVLLHACTTNYRKGKVDYSTEAVQLLFTTPHWDLKSYRQPYEVAEGTKLRAFGEAFALYNKQKEKAEPVMRVKYYEEVVGSSGSSSHSSPRESRATTPKMEIKPSDLLALEENVFKLLNKFERGTYAKRLSKVYQSEFKETPPENLLELAKAMPFVRTEKITDTDEVMHMKDEYRKKGSKTPAVDPQPPPPPPPPMPSTVTFTDEEHLYDVLVCFVNSPFSFYVQIRDDEQQQHMFTEMEEQMNKFFNKKSSKKEDVVVKENHLYACLWGDETEGQWCRAMVISQQDSKANILFPDYGNQDLVSISNLQTLPSQFYKLPFQAIHCCLHGVLMMDKMMSSEAVDYFAELAADKNCALHVMDCSGGRVSVEILDKELEDDENINSKFITRFHPIASLLPKLPVPGEPMVAVKLTDVDITGVLSIHVVGPGLSQLEELTKQIEERYASQPAAPVEVTVDGVYCNEYSMDHCWYRVRVMKELSSEQVLVEYIDYGNEEVVDKTMLRPGLDMELFSLPPQVVKCKLAGIPPPEGKWTERATDCLVQYIDIDELNLEVVDYCIRVTGPSSITLPVVKLHVKNSAQEMVCVNDVVLQDKSLFSDSETRASSSVSSAAEKEEATPRLRSESLSSLPSSRGELMTHENTSEAGSDVVFERQAKQVISGSQSPVGRQQVISGSQSPVGRQQATCISGSQSPVGRQQVISGSQSPVGRQQATCISGSQSPVGRQQVISGSQSPVGRQQATCISGSQSPVGRQQVISGSQSPVGRQQTTCMSDSQSPVGKKGLSRSQSPVGRQHDVSGRVSSASSNTQGSAKHTGSSSDGQGKNDTVTLNNTQIQDDVVDISTTSISSLEDNRDATEVTGGSCAEDVGKMSPNLPSSARTGNSQQSPVAADMTRLSLVDSPKVCIKDGVPYVPSPVPERAPVVQSGHLAVPPSAPRPSPPSSSSLSPSDSKSPPPITPPMSPPPPSVPLTGGNTVTEPEGGVGWGKWAELPKGKVVEVEVTWAPSPTNFTLLLWSSKPEVEKMSVQLQHLVTTEPYLSPESTSTGCVCAARYSMDGQWYRAIVRQPFQSQSQQTMVEFLDYGGIEQVPTSGLKCLPEKCQHLPFQAIKASLHGLTGDVSNPLTVKKFEDMVYTKRLFAIAKAFDSSSSRVSVVLLDTSDSSGKDVIINEVLS